MRPHPLVTPWPLMTVGPRRGCPGCRNRPVGACYVGEGGRDVNYSDSDCPLGGSEILWPRPLLVMAPPLLVTE